MEEKKTKSGSAIFMYIVIAITVTVTLLAFVLYYANIYKKGVILWTGIVAFNITYHFWGRIAMGNVTKLFGIRHNARWFKERFFEKKLYKALHVRKWKDKVLTYDPDAFSMEKNSLEDIANAMSKAETDHWINEIISLTTLLFPLIWGHFWLFFAVAVFAMLFDAQFIVVQRYNRPIVLRFMKKKQQRLAKINT